MYVFGPFVVDLVVPFLQTEIFRQKVSFRFPLILPQNKFFKKKGFCTSSKCNNLEINIETLIEL